MERPRWTGRIFWCWQPRSKAGSAIAHTGNGRFARGRSLRCTPERRRGQWCTTTSASARERVRDELEEAALPRRGRLLGERRAFVATTTALRYCVVQRG